MTKPTLISKFFTIGTSGPTIDGREISATHIDEMAATYNTDLYTALINLEHLEFTYPGFSLGKIVALRAQDAGGGKRKLQAQIEPTSALLAMNARKQKIFTSMEIVENFAETGRAYLMGLAVTDRPASIGVEALCFSAKNNGPATDRFKDNLFTSNFETENFTMLDDTNKSADTNFAPQSEAEESEKQTFAQKFTDIFKREQKNSDREFCALQDASLALASKFTELEDGFTSIQTANDSLKKQAELQQKEITRLSAALENMPENDTSRPLATGQSENQTDC